MSTFANINEGIEIVLTMNMAVENIIIQDQRMISDKTIRQRLKAHINKDASRAFVGTFSFLISPRIKATGAK